MRVVVVGAGISGLTAAWTLSRHASSQHDVTVLESGPHVGGRMRSEALGGATLELGAQFLSSHYTEIPRLAHEVGLSLTRVAPGTAVVRHGLRRFRSDRPATQFTGGVLPWRAVPAATAGLARVASLSRDRATSDLAAWTDVDGEAGDRWARRVLGRHVTHGLLEATINGFYFQSLADNAATLPAAVAAFGVSPGATLTIEGGLGCLPAALAAHLDVRTQSPVTCVARVGDEAVVTTPSGELRADRVILAVPGPAALDLLRDPTELERDLMATPYSTGLVVGLPLTRPLDSSRLGGAYGVLVHPAETTPLAAVAVASRAHHTTSDVLTVMFEHDAARALLGSDDVSIASTALDSLIEIDPLLAPVLEHERDRAVAAARVVRHPHAMPTCPPGHAAAVASYRVVAGDSPVILAGDYLGFPWTDSAAATGVWAAGQC